MKVIWRQTVNRRALSQKAEHMDFSTDTLYWLTNWLNHELPDCETGFHFWVRQLPFQFWVKPKSGNCGRFQFWAYPKVDTATRFQFWAVSTFGPAQTLTKHDSETEKKVSLLSLRKLSEHVLKRSITFEPVVETWSNKLFWRGVPKNVKKFRKD